MLWSRCPKFSSSVPHYACDCTRYLSVQYVSSCETRPINDHHYLGHCLFSMYTFQSNTGEWCQGGWISLIAFLTDGHYFKTRFSPLCIPVSLILISHSSIILIILLIWSSHSTMGLFLRLQSAGIWFAYWLQCIYMAKDQIISILSSLTLLWASFLRATGRSGSNICRKFDLSPASYWLQWFLNGRRETSLYSRPISFLPSPLTLPWALFLWASGRSGSNINSILWLP